MFQKKIIIAKPDDVGTYTVWYADGTMEQHVGISDNGGGGIKIVGSSSSGPVLGENAAGTIADSIAHGGKVANNIFNPFQSIQSAFNDGSPEGVALRQSARKAGYVVILLALLLMFIYLAFKD